MSVDQPHSLGAVLKCALFLIFFTVGISSYAQSYNNWSESNRIGGATQSSSSVMQGGDSRAAYQSTVYEPFNDTPPSENNSDRRGISGRRNSNYEGDVDLGEWGDPTTANPGDQSNEYPIGEPWIMLAFAAMAAIAIALRKKQTA